MENTPFSNRPQTSKPWERRTGCLPFSALSFQPVRPDQSLVAEKLDFAVTLAIREAALVTKNTSGFKWQTITPINRANRV